MAEKDENGVAGGHHVGGGDGKPPPPPPPAICHRSIPSPPTPTPTPTLQQKLQLLLQQQEERRRRRRRNDDAPKEEDRDDGREEESEIPTRPPAPPGFFGRAVVQLLEEYALGALGAVTTDLASSTAKADSASTTSSSSITAVLTSNATAIPSPGAAAATAASLADEDDDAEEEGGPSPDPPQPATPPDSIRARELELLAPRRRSSAFASASGSPFLLKFGALIAALNDDTATHINTSAFPRIETMSNIELVDRIQTEFEKVLRRPKSGRRLTKLEQSYWDMMRKEFFDCWQDVVDDDPDPPRLAHKVQAKLLQWIVRYEKKSSSRVPHHPRARRFLLTELRRRYHLRRQMKRARKEWLTRTETTAGGGAAAAAKAASGSLATAGNRRSKVEAKVVVQTVKLKSAPPQHVKAPRPPAQLKDDRNYESDSSDDSGRPVSNLPGDAQAGRVGMGCTNVAASKPTPVQRNKHVASTNGGGSVAVSSGHRSSATLHRATAPSGHRTSSADDKDFLRMQQLAAELTDLAAMANPSTLSRFLVHGTTNRLVNSLATQRSQVGRQLPAEFPSSLSHEPSSARARVQLRVGGRGDGDNLESLSRIPRRTNKENQSQSPGIAYRIESPRDSTLESILPDPVKARQPLKVKGRYGNSKGVDEFKIFRMRLWCQFTNLYVPADFHHAYLCYVCQCTTCRKRGLQGAFQVVFEVEGGCAHAPGFVREKDVVPYEARREVIKHLTQVKADLSKLPAPLQLRELYSISQERQHFIDQGMEGLTRVVEARRRVKQPRENTEAKEELGYYFCNCRLCRCKELTKAFVLSVSVVGTGIQPGFLTLNDFDVCCSTAHRGKMREHYQKNQLENEIPEAFQTPEDLKHDGLRVVVKSFRKNTNRVEKLPESHQDFGPVADLKEFKAMAKARFKEKKPKTRHMDY